MKPDLFSSCQLIDSARPLGTVRLPSGPSPRGSFASLPQFTLTSSDHTHTSQLTAAVFRPGLIWPQGFRLFLLPALPQPWHPSKALPQFYFSISSSETTLRRLAPHHCLPSLLFLLCPTQDRLNAFPAYWLSLLRTGRALDLMCPQSGTHWHSGICQMQQST